METRVIENAFDDLLKCEYERISETNLKVTLPIQPLFINSIGGFMGVSSVRSQILPWVIHLR